MRKKEKRARFKNKIRLLSLLFLILLLLGLGRKIFFWFSSSWDGQSQISLAVESETGEIFILTATPGKRMAVVLRLPKNLVLETPWFGEYRTDKLSLLAEQEGSLFVFPRSLSFFLGIPVDKGITGTGIDLGDRDDLVKNNLLTLFSPPQSVDEWKLRRYLGDREVIWRFVDLSVFSKEKSLPDGSRVLTVDPQTVDQTFWEFLTDPVVKNENLNISVFNVAEVDGLAQRVSSIITNMGGNVIEVESRPIEFDGECLILISSQDLAKTTTVKRLISLFDCQKKVSQEEGIGDVQLLIKNVKI